MPLRPAVPARLVWLLALCLAPHAALADDNPVALMDAGHFKRARALLEAREKDRPDDPATIFLRARYTLAGGEAKAALPMAEKAAALMPAKADYRYLVAQCVGSQAQKAGALKGLGLAKRFKREAEAALALDPRHLEAYEGLIEFYSIAPGIAGGSDKRARALAETLVTLDGARGRVAQANLDFRGKQADRGEQHLRAAVRVAPDSYPARMALVRFLIGDAQKKWDEAEQHARAALAAGPARIGPWSVLAFLDAHLERWEALETTLADAERAVPDNLGAYYQAARTLVTDDREPARAERYLRRYLAQEPELGAPSHALAHWRLGQAIEKQGRKSEAIAELETALKLRPDLDDAKKDLKRLRRG